ncbi:secreted protein containing DUF1223 [Rhodopirellula sallentina SM41]|uniref:Secreted protein containing DUF1223 n=2 Tax=Rhodopirellula TaxID=265488 RepID=M5U387_9BACT|nr:secreted protein containing DUF1223 [Rhodopirellula sallentina SM41]
MMHAMCSLFIGVATFFCAAAVPTNAVAQDRGEAQPDSVSDTPQSDRQQASAIAVVELFTSQGCSSCPSADRVLQAIHANASTNELPVHVLSFHVDYWNHLGWEDPYSSPASTLRQKRYAVSMGSKRIFTPQMIVNGTASFVGSDSAKADNEVQRALAKAATVSVDIKELPREADHTVAIQFNVTGRLEGCLLQVAAVDSPQANSVTRGENAGADLTHVGVVRAFESVRLRDSAGEVELNLPDRVSAADVDVIAYVQNPKTLAIIGATKLRP